MPEKIELTEVLQILEQWLTSSSDVERNSLAKRFEDLVGNFELQGASDAQEEWLLDLCTDFSYYTVDSRALTEDPTLRDTSSMRPLVVKILRKIQTHAPHVNPY